MKLYDDIAVFGDPVDEGALTQIRRSRRHPAVVGAAMMADHHRGYGVPIGGVLAYDGSISPSGVGYDIACGNKAVLTDMPAAEARRRIVPIMDDIWNTISFGVGRRNAERVDHPLFDDPAWSVVSRLNLRDRAAAQLGTVGSGNHYVDILVDEAERVWVGVHFGSRGLGHGIATWALRAGGAGDGMDVDPLVLEAASTLGAEYLAGMHLAGRYAYAGRDWVCDRVVRLLGATVLDEVHNHHNFAWPETHHGREVWVVRKGATPAFPGQRGFVGGSMGDDAVIVEGVEEGGPGQAAAMYSTVHGAGRVMGRMHAKGKVRRRFVKDPAAMADQRRLEREVKEAQGPQREVMGREIARLAQVGEWREEVVRPGAISAEQMREWISARGVELRGSDVDEAPQAYKRLPEVLAHHAGTIRILHTLRPIGVAMAGRTEFDPYRD